MDIIIITVTSSKLEVILRPLYLNLTERAVRLAVSQRDAQIISVDLENPCKNI
jgi:hypothetical protein